MMDNPVHEYGCRHGLGNEQVPCRGCGELTENLYLCDECDELGRADQELDSDE